MNHALLIAFHYPPVTISSGLQRTLAISAHLPDAGWQPVVLSAHPRAYAATDDGQLKDIPPQVHVERAFALDASRHFAVKGRYFKWLALPDPWVTWWLGGVVAGLRLIRRYRPAVIWSTYPIATAHLIGMTLHRLTGIPWVADFRDPMTQDGYPPNKLKRAIYQWIERRSVASCAFAVFTTPGTAALYRSRYPDEPESRWRVIPNGYDESIFREVEEDLRPQSTSRKGPLTLLHSGVIYPNERNPRAFFDALAELRDTGELDERRVKVMLRATAHDPLYQQSIERRDLQPIVELLPAIPFREALAESFSADGLIVLQGNSCNEQIPAKLYEYFRTGRPILTLADPEGDTAKTAREAGLEAIAPLEDKDQIKDALRNFLTALENGTAASVASNQQPMYGRREGVMRLAALFDETAGT